MRSPGRTVTRLRTARAAAWLAVRSFRGR